MADNYLEKKMEDMQNRLSAKKAKEQRARQIAYKKRMDAYRKKLEAEAALKSSPSHTITGHDSQPEAGFSVSCPENEQN